MLAFLLAAALIYLALTLAATWAVQAYPRQPVNDPPDWGEVTDTSVSAVDGGRLECWIVSPNGPCRGTVVFVHGWGRNRDRMVPRARLFGRWGYRTVLFSARDHGGSSRSRPMNAIKFAEDIESVLETLPEPVVLYGHSAGSGGAAIAAARDSGRIRLLILEASYPDTRRALMSLYRWAHPAFGLLFGRAILFWMDRFYPGALDRTSPGRLASAIAVPVLLVHGEADRRFPVAFAQELHRCFASGQADLFVAPGAGHSESSQDAGYAEAVAQFLTTRSADAEGIPRPGEIGEGRDR